MFRRIGKNDPCWCGSGKPYCECHMAFDQKISRARFAGHEVPSHKIIKTPAQIEGIRESGKLNVAVLDYVAEHIRAGITTEEIDQWVYDFTTKHGGIPAPLNYEGFPKSVCTSINDQVCHGIPSGRSPYSADRELQTVHLLPLPTAEQVPPAVTRPAVRDTPTAAQVPEAPALALHQLQRRAAIQQAARTIIIQTPAA